MKILFVNSLADAELGGGAEVILWEQVRGLSRRGHDCVLLATSDTRGLSVTEIDGVRVWRAGIRNLYWPTDNSAKPPVPLRMAWHALDSYNALMQRFIRQVVAKETPDVASLHNLAGWSAATYHTLSTSGVPAVQILHDTYLICVKSSMRNGAGNCDGNCLTCRPFRLPHRRLTRHLQAVVGVSHFILDLHIGMGYFAGVRTRCVIHNAREYKSLGLGKTPEHPHLDGLRFGYIGTLNPEKGVDSLIDGFMSANFRGGDATLWIAGSGKQAYEQELRQACSDERISFKGRMEPQAFYSQVDVVVVPSLLNESFGLVALEALAFGKPVIGSRRGGIPEMIRHGENGLLFEPDTDGELANCLSLMYEDDDLRARLTANAKPSSAPFIDFDGWIDRYERLFHDVALASISV